MSNVSALYTLQKIDTARDQQLARLAEISSQLGETDAMRAVQAHLAELAKQKAELAKQSKRLTDEADAVRDKCQRSETRLYSGSVTNPKELQDIQKEIEALTRQANGIDDKQLELMVEIEDLEAQQQAADAQLADLTAAWQVEQTGLLAEQAQHQAQVEQLNQQRLQALNNVMPAQLVTYDKLRKTKRGTAVSVLSREGICSGCGLGVSTSRRQQASKADGLVYCDNCGRIWMVD